MYDLPSRSDVESFTITRELVEKRSKAKVLRLADAGERDDRRGEVATA
jgi:ATP-dependent Clp protease ATP-binding subunit ClpX